MIERRGTAYVVPLASHLPGGRMVDPEVSVFHVSWQDWDDEKQMGELIENGGEIVGTEAAIAPCARPSDRSLGTDNLATVLDEFAHLLLVDPVLPADVEDRDLRVDHSPTWKVRRERHNVCGSSSLNHLRRLSTLSQTAKRNAPRLRQCW